MEKLLVTIKREEKNQKTETRSIMGLDRHISDIIKHNEYITYGQGFVQFQRHTAPPLARMTLKCAPIDE